MGIPGERAYYPTMDFVWDTENECTASSLRQGVAAHYGLPVDSIEIAKYFPEKFEWMPISSWVMPGEGRTLMHSSSSGAALCHLSARL